MIEWLAETWRNIGVPALEWLVETWFKFGLPALEWLAGNWLKIAVPVLVFIATYVIGLWLRRILSNAFDRWQLRTKWEGSRLVIAAVRRPFLSWFLLLGISIAVQISALPAEAKMITVKAAGSLFVLSLGWTVIVLSERLLRIYLPRIKASRPTIALVISAVRITFIIIGALIVLDIWGIPTTPLLLLIVVVVLGAALVLRNAAPDLFAGFQIGATQQIKEGDYIKLETGEEGYVVEMNWNNTRIKTLGESFTVVPNSRLLQRTVINYGRPLKKAKEPFHFYSRTHITELTGLKARNLQELVDTLKKVPDAVVYYHTHRFLEQHHYLTPEPSNDFAVWISDALGDEILGERLASVDTFQFPDLGALRSRLVGIIEEYLTAHRDTKGATPAETLYFMKSVREAMAGEEFYFMKSVSVILPTTYVVSDLREFVETLRRISLGSLYFHIFESRLRLGKGLNDFSVWIRDTLEETGLAEEIGRLDPYTYTLEGLRLALIQLIEKRIK
ncbi:MAG: mechanosensitive ion channel family protein [Dehalococcoidia bacterium]|nr:MAG: mechanosensitive ion channel family protein [Dehalococcoidia bacterium]